jgi:alkylation response protein AidB-like acyl-CoA dehydrogenase
MSAVELPPWAEAMFAAATSAGEDVRSGLELACRYGARLPQAGAGQTETRWRLLAEVSARDLTVGRILEAHSDALAILAEADEETVGGTWGVFAAEGPGARLDAEAEGGRYLLTGAKPWCSLAGELDHALVTAHIDDERQLFAVDLRQPQVRVGPPSGWVARGLRNVVSSPVHFVGASARAVGEPGWYLNRPGFAWGGMGVAACWYGGALAVGRSLRAAMTERGGDLAALYVGTVDVALHGASSTLSEAARQVDAGQAGEVLALRVRGVVADAVERTLMQAGHALGPARLAFDEEHARRVADLELYVRQHHAEYDLARLGNAVLAGDQS